MDWENAHSPVMWAYTWRTALADARAGGVSYLLVRMDDEIERVVGHFFMAGRDPRTGGAEMSTWAADVPPAVSAWALLTTVLSAFEGNPNIPFVLAPAAASNVRANRFFASLDWLQLQTRRALRRYDGQVSDHHIWMLANTSEGRDAVRHRLAEIASTERPFTPSAHRTPSLEYLVAWGRHQAIRTKQVCNVMLQSTPRQTALEISPNSGELVRIEPTAQDRYRVSVAQRPCGSVEVHSDIGTSTTELVPRFSSWAPDNARVSAISALASHLADRPDGSRRTVVAVRDIDTSLANRLASLGFIDEGEAPPTLGEVATPRRMWTLLRIR
ncbi:hypothetical protein [Mycobacteroides sp. LB1]|uniref:hypothetical protein n=1 Tax=Mycobacteroides sp. LB1 TaxID=2750814 RepID=UPI0015DF8E1D|nr:hypothetical protein [Mycobacteroides sp. LB1]